jgi:hypothetical protein
MHLKQVPRASTRRSLRSFSLAIEVERSVTFTITGMYVIPCLLPHRKRFARGTMGISYYTFHCAVWHTISVIQCARRNEYGFAVFCILDC